MTDDTRVVFYSTKKYDRQFFDAANAALGFSLKYLEPKLDLTTAELAHGADCVCAFVNDTLDAEVLARLSELGVRLLAMRCAGYNNVDLAAAERLGLQVVRVPAYSPYAVAEHTLALMLTLNRKVHRSHNRVREGNFALEGLLGFDMHGLTAGVVGTGKIGQKVISILRGFGCEVLCSDPYPNEIVTALGATYTDIDTLMSRADIITLHCPLTPESKYLINPKTVAGMKPNVMLINTSRGGLVDSRAVIEGLKSGQIGYLGLDVYEEEASLFFEDHSDEIIHDDVFARLLTFPNVIITAHQAFFTQNALQNIAETTLGNIADITTTGTSPNLVKR